MRPNNIDNWSLTSLQPQSVKTGGRLIKHARYFWLLLAEGYLTRRMEEVSQEVASGSTVLDTGGGGEQPIRAIPKSEWPNGSGGE